MNSKDFFKAVGWLFLLIAGVSTSFFALVEAALSAHEPGTLVLLVLPGIIFGSILISIGGCKFYELATTLFETDIQEIAANNAANTEWISMEERLPDRPVTAQVTDGEIVAPADWDGAERRWLLSREDGAILQEDTITHWAPFLEPPQG